MKNIILIVLFILVLWIQSRANIFNGKDEITLVGDRMEVDSTKVYDILLHNAPEDFQEPNVPSVVIVGKKGKFIFGVGDM